MIGGIRRQFPTNMIAQVWQFDPSAAVGSRWLTARRLASSSRDMFQRRRLAESSTPVVVRTTDGTTHYRTRADSFKYDPGTNIWTPIANIPRATGETRAVVMNNQMWVLGGGRTLPNPSGQVDVYDPTSQCLEHRSAVRRPDSVTSPRTAMVAPVSGEPVVTTRTMRCLITSNRSVRLLAHRHQRLVQQGHQPQHHHRQRLHLQHQQ